MKKFIFHMFIFMKDVVRKTKCNDIACNLCHINEKVIDKPSCDFNVFLLLLVCNLICWSEF